MSGRLPWRLHEVVRALAAGDVVACPTEAVWGLSCDPWQGQAVQRLLQLKQRPQAKGLILVAGDETQLEPLLAGLDDSLRRKMRLSWPGPNTWLVPHNGRIPDWVHGDFDTVAVRVSAHTGVAELCRAWGGPLVSTSANRGGCQPAIGRFQVQRYFGAALGALAPGAVGAERRPSVIRDLYTDRVIRA